MANTKIYTKCPQCGGDGIRSMPDASVQPPVLHDIPCTTCVAGYIDLGEIDLVAITDELAYIHTKVKKIWNKVKDGDPEE